MTVSVAIQNNPLKQAIVNGITNWLNKQAPASMRRDMRQKDIFDLLDSIAANLDEEHFKRPARKGEA